MIGDIEKGIANIAEQNLQSDYLEPCPMAAQDAIVEIQIIHGRVGYRIRCINDGCFCGPYMSTLWKAIERWNKWCEVVEKVEILFQEAEDDQDEKCYGGF